MFKIVKKFCSNYNKLNNILKERISPDYLKIIDNSANHGEPTDSHFNVILVSEKFEGLTHIKRHRYVFDILKEKKWTDEIHAISWITKTSKEFEKI